MQTDTPSGWAIGWTAFAAMTMIMMGFWWLTSGLVAIVNPDFYVATADYIFKFDVKTWGWIHLLTGFVILAAGFGLFNGATWARTVGVIMALRVSQRKRLVWLTLAAGVVVPALVVLLELAWR